MRLMLRSVFDEVPTLRGCRQNAMLPWWKCDDSTDSTEYEGTYQARELYDLYEVSAAGLPSLAK